MYKDLQQNDHVLNQKRYLITRKKSSQMLKWEEVFAVYRTEEIIYNYGFTIQ